MRICIVCPRLCHGGAERVGVLLANGFSNRGNEVMVVSNLYEEQTYELDPKIKVKNLVLTNRNKLLKWGSSFFLMRKYLKEYRPDVTIGIANTCSFVAKIAGVGMGIPVVMTEHDAFERPPSAPFSFWKYFAKYRLNKIYKYVTVLTKADERLVKNKLKGVFVMPNPLALSPNNHQSFGAERKNVLACGRLDDWHYKGFDVLIRSWGILMQNEELRMKNPGWKLQIGGTGSENSLNYLRQLCKENGVGDSVEFLGFRKDVEKLYQDASIFVLSSRYEGFGLVLIEAMSQGCACVACDYKGRQREMIQDDSQGLCCEPENAEALAEALGRMMTDEKYRESIRENAIERSKFYSIDNTITRWEELLTQIVKK